MTNIGFLFSDINHNFLILNIPLVYVVIDRELASDLDSDLTEFRNVVF